MKLQLTRIAAALAAAAVCLPVAAKDVPKVSVGATFKTAVNS